MYRVNLSSSESGSDSSDGSYYTSESETSEAPAKQKLRELAERRRVKFIEKAQEKQKKLERRVPGLRTEAKGDLSAVDEREEDWEEYKEKGGQKSREQFSSDNMVAGFETYMKRELKIKPEASEHDFAEAQWYLLLKDALKLL